MELWIQLLGAAGAGAVINQYIARARERREVRATAMRALSRSEQARWAGGDDRDRDFHSAAAELETASLIAGIPRPMVAQYLILADAARILSQESWDEDPDPEFGGGINGALAETVRQAARFVADSAWHPYVSRLHQRTRLNMLRQQVDALSASDRWMFEQRSKYSRW